MTRPIVYDSPHGGLCEACAEERGIDEHTGRPWPANEPLPTECNRCGTAFELPAATVITGFANMLAARTPLSVICDGCGHEATFESDPRASTEATLQAHGWLAVQQDGELRVHCSTCIAAALATEGVQ